MVLARNDQGGLKHRQRSEIAHGPSMSASRIWAYLVENVVTAETAVHDWMNRRQALACVLGNPLFIDELDASSRHDGVGNTLDIGKLVH